MKGSRVILSLLFPKIYLKSITHITPAMLGRLKIRGLILDVDNTLTTHDNPTPDHKVLSWLEIMRSHDIGMIILSNNRPARVSAFAQLLGMDFVAKAGKPKPGGFRQAAGRLGLSKVDVAVVGDQIFTDILGGNIWGATTILVKPMELEITRFFRLKRRLERDILKSYRKNRQGGV